MSALPHLQARKQPLQSRSRATVDAIRQASIEVLLTQGLQRTTTTRVAERAGVSVGSLYQYYPNRSAMLAALLAWHLDGVAQAVEDACTRAAGQTIDAMSQALVAEFLRAKLQQVDMSLALYAISEMHGGGALVVEGRTRMRAAAVAMLESACDARFDDVERTAEVALGALIGPMRALLDDGAPADRIAPLRAQLTLLVRSFLHASKVPS